MQMTAVYACVRILSEAIAGLPLHLYRYGKDGNKEKAMDHALYRLLHDEPNPEMTSFIIRETDQEGKVTEHIQEIKGYRGQPQTVDIDSDDWKL